MSGPSTPTNVPRYGEYDSHMINPQAAVMVMDHVPDSDEVTELATLHLDEFPADFAHATVEIVNEPPQWLEVHERDQMAAFLRDGGPETCILVIYMQEASEDELEDEDEDADDF